MAFSVRDVLPEDEERTSKLDQLFRYLIDYGERWRSNAEGAIEDYSRAPGKFQGVSVGPMASGALTAYNIVAEPALSDLQERLAKSLYENSLAMHKTFSNFDQPTMLSEPTMEDARQQAAILMMAGVRRPRLYGKGKGKRGRPTKADASRQLEDLEESRRLQRIETRQAEVMIPPSGQLVTTEDQPRNPVDFMIEDFEAKVVALEDYFDSIKQKSFEPDKAWNEQKGQSETIPKGVIDPHAQAPRPVYDYRMQSEQALADWSSRRSGLPAEDIGPFKWRQMYANPDFQFDHEASALAERSNDALWSRFDRVGEVTKGGKDILAELKNTKRVLAETGNLTWMGKAIDGPTLESIVEGIHGEIESTMDQVFEQDAKDKKQLQSESLARSRGKELGEEYSPEVLKSNYAKALEVLEGTKPLTEEYLATASERGIRQTKRRKAEVALEEAQELLQSFESGGEKGLREFLGYPYVDRPGVEQISAKEGSYLKLDEITQKGLYSIGFEPEHFDAEGDLTPSGQKRLTEWQRESSAPEGQELAVVRKPTGIETGHLGREEYYDRGTMENWRMMQSMTPPEVRSYLLEQAKFRTDKLNRQLGDPFRNYMKGMKEWGFTAPEYQDPLSNRRKTLYSDKMNAYQELREAYNHVTDLLYEKQQSIDMSTPEGRYESAKFATQALESINSTAEYISLLEREPTPHKKGSASGLWVDESGRGKKLMLQEGEGGHSVIEPLEKAFAPPRERNVYLSDQHMYADTISLPDHDANKLFEYAREEVGAPSGFAGGQGRKFQDWRKAMIKEAESVLLKHSNYEEIAAQYLAFLEDQESPPLSIYDIQSDMKKLEDLVRAKFNMTAQFEFIQADKWGRDDFVMPDFPKWYDRLRKRYY